MERLGIIVLNWNRADLTKRAVRSLESAKPSGAFVVVVDNGSDGNEADSMRLELGVDVLAIENNVGYARAMNVGAAEAMRRGADFILFFNNDAFVETGSAVLAEMLAAFRERPRLGAVGVPVQNNDETGTVQSASYTFSMWFPVPIASRQLPQSFQTLGASGVLSGSCVMVRAEAFAKLGGFDPDFFFYGDDVDFARRLHEAGYQLGLIPSLGIKHERGTSIRVGSSRYVYTALRSNLILVLKHARWYQRPVAVATCFAASIALILLGARNGNPSAAGSVGRAWRDFVLARWGGFEGSVLSMVRRPSLEDLRHI
jgi:N-acetylglucosaminyl-diphospho-decaprenol L-rhamnosyltransferase